MVSNSWFQIDGIRFDSCQIELIKEVKLLSFFKIILNVILIECDVNVCLGSRDRIRNILITKFANLKF